MVKLNHHVEKFYKNKGFLRWFLNKYHLKEEKTRTILEYILNNDELLNRVNLVEDIRLYANAILISSEDAKTVSYLLRIEGKYFEDIDEFMGVLKTKPSIDLCLWLAFNREFVCFTCSGKVKQTSEVEFSNKAKQQVHNIEKSINSFLKVKQDKKELILLAIDNTLENNNEQEFIRLSKLLKGLEV